MKWLSVVVVAVAVMIYLFLLRDVAFLLVCLFSASTLWVSVLLINSWFLRCLFFFVIPLA